MLFRSAPAIEGIAAVQGSGEHSPHAGAQARIEGVVTLVWSDGAAFVQSLAADADPATSEGLLVIPAAGQPLLAVGQHLVAEGRVAESGDGALLTSLADAVIELRGSAPLPEPVVLDAPPPSWEALEGMRVRIDAELMVVGNDALSRFDAAALVESSMLAEGDFGLIFTQVEWSDGFSSYIAPYTQSADDGSEIGRAHV